MATISGGNIHRRRPSDTWKVRPKMGERIHVFETGTADQREAKAQAVATRPAMQEQGVVFDPEAVELMAGAYLAACRTLGLKEHLDDGVRRLVALRIIGAAADGEREPAKLHERGVHNASRPVG